MTQINKQNLGGAVYSAPSISAIDMELEGVLCGSGDLTINEWQRDEDVLEF